MAVWRPFGGGVVGRHGRVAPVALDGVLARGGEGTEKGGARPHRCERAPSRGRRPILSYFILLFFCVVTVFGPPLCGGTCGEGVPGPPSPCSACVVSFPSCRGRVARPAR